MAPCIADTNDLALDPAMTAEDIQHTQQSILPHTWSVSHLLSVPPSVLLHLYFISHAYLLLPFHLCHLSFLSLPLLLRKMQSLSVSFNPNTFNTSYHFICTSHPLRWSLNYSLCPSQFISLRFLLSLSLLPIFPPRSFSLSAQPTASLSLGRGEQCRSTWGPSAVPAEKAGSTGEHP